MGAAGEDSTGHVGAAPPPMVDAGSARIVSGNHEFNAIAWAIEDGSGRHYREHKRKDERYCAPHEGRAAYERYQKGAST
jgi:hypothetical protein